MRLRRALAAAVLLPLAGLTLAALATARRGEPALHPPRAGEATVDVFVVRNWLHANLAVPTAALGSAGPAAQAAALLPGGGEWMLLGWGDARHYRERGRTLLRLLDLWRSFLRPGNPAVIHLQPLAAQPTPETTGKPVLRLRLSGRGFEALRRRLDASFALKDGAPVVAGRGRDPAALFFHSLQRGDLRKVCNHWVADLLDAAGAPTTPVLDTLTAGLAWDLERRAGARPVRGVLGEPADVTLETPPAYSGRFAPSDPVGRAGGDLHLDGYGMRFACGPRWTTAPVALVRADAPQAPGRSWAELLGVAPGGLVETRRVEAGGDGPWAEPVRSLAVGFRLISGKRYELSLALFTSAAAEGAPWAVKTYRQP